MITCLPMKRSLSTLFCLACFILIAFSVKNSTAQQVFLHGHVVDSISGERIAGAHIFADTLALTSTDEDGRYQFVLATGSYAVTVSCIGYNTMTFRIDLIGSDSVYQVLRLKPGIQLQTAVISASRYEQRLSDVSVSMEVIKAGLLNNLNTRQLDEALSILPGVDVIDGQANIRNGSGYSYGAGSRVMLLVDGMPLLTGDVNDIKWSFLPVENIGQVEVVKGASSALYGSSALNGVINIRTGIPGPEPVTHLEVLGGAYMRPERKEVSWWWDRVPFYGGVRALHQRRVGRTSLTAGLVVYGDEGYREDNYLAYGRVSFMVDHRLKGDNNISIGLRTALHFQEFSDFFIWQDADSGAFLQQEAAVTPTNGIRFNADPYMIAYDKRNGKHIVQGRFFRVTNHFREDPDKENSSGNYFGEYQYHRDFGFGLHLSAGASGSYSTGRSNLYGNHNGNSIALFTQLDQQVFRKLMVNLGLRWERYALDRNESGSRPVLRAGVNYNIAGQTRIRASFGQGYRYPSMTEKYTSTSLSSVHIFPNPELNAESGWSVEAGVQQGFIAGTWSGFINLVAFRTEYTDMIEFTFGLYKPDSVEVPTLDHIGFKPLNTGEARIDGIEITLNTQGNIGAVRILAFAGYTYTDPVEMSDDSLQGQILKYRYRHSVKADIQTDISAFSFGLTLVYRSFMERIDSAFEDIILGQEIFPGLKDYRAANNKGNVVIDLRAAWQLTRSSRLTMVFQNILNEEYMGRPGDIGPPLNFNLKYELEF